MRTHFIMNAHRLTTLPDIKAEVANVKQAESAVMTKAGDAMDVDSFSNRPKELPNVLDSGRTPRSLGRRATKRPSAARDGKVVEKASRRARRKAIARRKATAKVPKRVKGKKGFEGKCFKCGKSGHTCA